MLTVGISMQLQCGFSKNCGGGGGGGAGQFRRPKVGDGPYVLALRDLLALHAE